MFSNIIHATAFILAGFLVFWVLGFLIAELFFRKVPDVGLTKTTLEDRVYGVFHRRDSSFPLVGKSIDLPAAVAELSVIPDACLPLLTHLQPSELVAFLGCGDDVRSTLLSTHPPSTHQRVASLRLESSNRTSEMLGVFLMTFCPWKGNFRLAVTLDSTIEKMSKSREV